MIIFNIYINHYIFYIILLFIFLFLLKKYKDYSFFSKFTIVEKNFLKIVFFISSILFLWQCYIDNRIINKDEFDDIKNSIEKNFNIKEDEKYCFNIKYINDLKYFMLKKNIFDCVKKHRHL
jgi:hypothetical protein